MSSRGARSPLASMVPACTVGLLLAACGGQTVEREPGAQCVANSVQPLLESVELPLPAFVDSIGTEPQLAAFDLASLGIVYVGLESRESTRFDGAGALCRLPAYCVVASEGQVILHRDLTSKAGVWTAARVTEIALEPGGSGGALGAAWGNGDVLLTDEQALYRLTVDTGTVVRLIELSRRRPVRVIPGDPPQLVTLSNQGDQTVYEVAALDDSPKWAPIASVRALKWGGTVVPAGKDWFILQDGSQVSPDRIDVWHVSGGSADYVGKGDSMLLEVASTEPGAISPEGHATLPHCEKRECRLFAVDLMVPALTQTARIDVPEDHLSIASFRRAACDGADMVVGGYDDGDPDGISNFYSVHLH